MVIFLCSHAGPDSESNFGPVESGPTTPELRSECLVLTVMRPDPCRWPGANKGRGAKLYLLLGECVLWPWHSNASPISRQSLEVKNGRMTVSMVFSVLRVPCGPGLM